MRELFDVQRQNFWTESIHKEAYTRLAWHEKYSKEFARESREGGQAALARKKRPDMVPKVKMIPVQSLKAKKAAAAAEKGDASKAQEDSKKQFAALAENNPNALLDEMRPVTGNVRHQLYQGFSKEGTGRYAYLQIRKMKKPENKYEVPLTSSWEYGWRLNDVVNDFRAPAHGRSRIVKDSFYRTNGIF